MSKVEQAGSHDVGGTTVKCPYADPDLIVQVIFEDTGEPVAAATINTEGPKACTGTTDEVGLFTFKTVPAGSYQIVATLPDKVATTHGKPEPVTVSASKGGSVLAVVRVSPVYWFEIELRDEDGDLVPNEPFKILARDKDDVLAEGALDAKAHARVAPGSSQCRVVFPNRDHRSWVFGVLGIAPKQDDVLKPLDAPRWIEIELQDEYGEPVAGEKYQIVRRDGTVLKEGTTNSHGSARIDSLEASECAIVYPGRDSSTWVFGVRGNVRTPQEVAKPLSASNRWIEFELRDEYGRPVAGEKYQIIRPNGSIAAEGTLNAQGSARCDVTLSECAIVYPGRDHSTWVFGVLGEKKKHRDSETPIEAGKHWIEIELRDENGEPVAGEKIKVLRRNGTVAAEATLDSNGCARVEVDTAECSIVYSRRDHNTWVFGIMQS